MNKEKLLYILMPILCAVALVLGYIKTINKTPEETDALKFKKEYESLTGEKYVKLDIPEDNPIVYADYDKLLEVIDNGTGIIYLGFPGCPWCRSALPVLLDAAKENNVETIYYMNILNERESYIVEEDKLVYAKDEDGNEKKGTKGYFKLLKALDKHLTDYKIEFEGKKYKVGEKRIYAPTVIFVRDGKVLGLHVSTVESQENPREKLSKKQYEELYTIYDEYIIEVKSGTCSIGTSC